MAAKEINIKIVVDGDKEEITVVDDAGNMTALQSVMVIGGGFESQAFYVISGGSGSDLGWALGNAYRYVCASEREEEGHLRKAYHQMLAWIATFKGWAQGEDIDPDTILRRWAEEDRKKAEKEAGKVKYLN